jgi:CHAT domain-containing protein
MNTKRTIALVVIVLFVHISYSQTPQNDTIYGNKLLENVEKLQYEALKLKKKADTLRQRKSFKKSDKIALQAASTFKEANEIALQATIIFKKAENWEQWYQAYRLILLSGYYSGDYFTSIEMIEEAYLQIPKKEIRTQAKFEYLLGYCYSEIGAVAQAATFYENSTVNLQKMKKIDPNLLNLILGNLCIQNVQLGEYWKAQKHAKLGIVYAKKENDELSLWKNTKALGEAYLYAEEYEEARKTFRKAQQIIDNNDGTFELYEALVLFGLNEFDAAIKIANTALQLAQHCESKDCKENAMNSNKLLGEIYLEIEKPAKALNYFQSNLPLAMARQNKRVIAKLYNNIGITYAALKDYDNALEIYQQALSVLIPKFQERDPVKNPLPNDWIKEIWLADIFKNKGDCFLKKYEQTSDEKWLQLASENYKAAVDASELKRQNFTETTSKLSLGSYSNEFYEKLIHVKLMLAQQYEKETYKHEAFLHSQRANAFVLRELMNEKQALQSANIPEDTIAEYQQYQKEIAILEKEETYLSKKKKDSLKHIKVQQQLIDTEIAFKNFKNSIEEKYPKFSELRNDLNGISVAALQKHLKENTQLIKYFLGKETVYCFSVTKDDFYVDQIALPDDFEYMVEKYRNAISNREFINNDPLRAEQEYLETAEKLYTYLLKTPLQHTENKGIDELIIIPDGILQKISFNALQMQPSDSWTKATHAAIKKYAIGYHYFCKMVANTRPVTSHEEKFTSFGISFDDETINYLESIISDTLAIDSDFTVRNSLSKLNFAAVEATELAELMGGKSWINKEATKANFLTHANNVTSIHLSTHSVVNIENPDTSSLIFTKSDDTISNLLQLDEIYQHHFNAEMITLSACNTGYGRYDKGEGLQSLARAFNFANIPSVTATLWSIPDAASATIMKSYYAYLQQGYSKNKALQKAQLEYLENDEISSPARRLPFYWAAWTHIGDDIPIATKKTPYYIYLIVVLSIIFLVSLGLFWFKK